MTCAYRVDGPQDAPPLLLLHAIATSGELWAPQLAVWSSVFRVISIDLPGHGASVESDGPTTLDGFADEVIKVLDEIGVQKVSLLGLSLGGMVAQAFALKYPERLDALILAHTGARTDRAVADVWEARIQQSMNDGFESQIGPTLERWFTRRFTNCSPVTLQWLRGIVRTTSMNGYVNAIRAIQKLDHLDRLSEICHPTLIIAGREDTAVPPAKAEAMAKQLPNCELQLIEGAAHIGNIEQPVAFTEAVAAFLLKQGLKRDK